MTVTRVLGTAKDVWREPTFGSAYGRETNHLSDHHWADMGGSQLPVAVTTAFGIDQRLERFVRALESKGEEPAPTSGR